MDCYVDPTLTLTPFQKRVFFLKYDVNGKKKRSNKEIAENMGYSEETVRTILIKIIARHTDAHTIL
jgi:DNA-directed RNA polymerase sigma subunit (sigma70/sigma32)